MLIEPFCKMHYFVYTKFYLTAVDTSNNLDCVKVKLHVHVNNLYDMTATRSSDQMKHWLVLSSSMLTTPSFDSGDTIICVVAAKIELHEIPSCV